MRMRLESIHLRLFAIPFAAAALTVGCGEGKILQSPTGPSGMLGSTTFLTANGAATAASVGESAALAKGGNGKNPGDQDVQGPGSANKPVNPGRSHQERVVGFVSAKAGNVLTVNDISVVAGLDAIIRHGNRILTVADIEVGDHVQARGAMEGTTLVAVEIKVQDTGRDNADIDEADLEGTVSSLTGTCPAVSFMIGSTKVTTNAATVFDDVTCSALANSARVEVEGTTQADGSILASNVEAQAGPDEVEGTVFEFSGAASCPAATLKVGPTLSLATNVTLTNSTTFTGAITCATIANGQHVEIEGTEQADGSITAANVELH